MGHGALNQGVSKIEIPGKSQMALNTDKWLWLAVPPKYRLYPPHTVQKKEIVASGKAGGGICCPFPV